MSISTGKDEKQKLWKEMNFKEKCKHIRNSITIEPMLACYIMPSVLAGLATQNLNLEKACRVNLNYSDEICDALSARQTANYTEEEREVQTLVAGMQGWKTVLQSLMPCLLILFWGSWSDRHGRRKPCMIIPIIGELASALGLILNTYFTNWPMEVAGVTEALFPGLAGGWFTMLMGVFSYIADITTEEERTLRIGIVNLCFSLGVPIGMAFSGILLKQIGFYGIFSISASFYVLALIYGIFFVEEPNMKINEKDKLKAKEKGLIADFFDKEHVIQTFRVAFKKGENQRRLRVTMILIVVMVVIGPMHGEMSVIYLFTRYKFNWSEVEFSFFSTYAMLTSLIGTLFSVGVFSHLLQIDDAIIGVLSSMSKIISSFVYAFASTTWQLYLAPIAEILNGTSFIAMRSIASKLVQSDELGKVNSLFGVGEALTPLLYAPMYTQVYRATIDVLPGAFFLLGGALTFPAVLIFLWMYKKHKEDDRRRQLLNRPENFNNIDDPESNKEQEAHVISNRFGSTRRNSTFKSRHSMGIINNSFVADDDKVIQEAVDIIGDLPALHLEHCKL
ncbi:lysosomal proton-coupled steroid conjugate and bile acid symporter SLC46A3-like [Chironomus tepperi]|uniref:lysosomal proton-coupled steroid conjugate and bile acid symporter SLC46A3-like n=1 Tax=Chironomus tepperi TaxID=113505 RepID=UPI00391EF467